MIKLTDMDGFEVYIRKDHVSKLTRVHEGCTGYSEGCRTSVTMRGNGSLYVKESIEVVLEALDA